MDPEYLDAMKGDMSDLRNASADRKAGTITAGKFLEQFVDGTPWAHLDIAGTCWVDKAQPNCGTAPAAWPCGRLCVWPKAGASDLAKRKELR